MEALFISDIGFHICMYSSGPLADGAKRGSWYGRWSIGIYALMGPRISLVAYCSNGIFLIVELPVIVVVALIYRYLSGYSAWSLPLASIYLARFDVHALLLLLVACWAIAYIASSHRCSSAAIQKLVPYSRSKILNRHTRAIFGGGLRENRINFRAILVPPIIQESRKTL